MPLVWLVFFIAYIDRANLANVRVLEGGTPDAIETSLGIDGNNWNWAIALPYYGFLVAEAPSNIALVGVALYQCYGTVAFASILLPYTVLKQKKKFSARFWLARIIVSWGIVVMCMAAVTNTAGLLAARFVLGLCEAGLIPGVYFTFWYKPTERATRNALFYTAVSVGGGVSGLAAIGLGRMNGTEVLAMGVHHRSGLMQVVVWDPLNLTLDRWTKKGIPAILIGIAVYLLLPEFPHSPTTYLTPEEQNVAIIRLPKNAPTMHDKNFVLDEAITLFLQPAQWLFMASFFCMSFGIVGTSNFLPSILSGMGFTTSVQQNLFSAFPSFWGILTYGVPAWHSDYTRERVWHGLIPSIICTISVALLVTAAKNPPTDTNPGFMPNWARYLMFFGIGIQSGSQPVLINYVPGLTIAGVVFGVGVGLYACIPLALRYQNSLARKRMEAQGIPIDTHEKEAIEEKVVADV
ncbi:hypothetical protein HDU93_005548 [Gonapodya sp. JEL0774]|nr:hypothetical protein HDU93_005548 [Gonapodya sp. JEL0774]